MEPILSGRRINEDNTAWVDWWCYARLTEEETQKLFDECDLGDGYESGPGRVFRRPASARHSRSYTLIKRGGGLDV